MSSPPNEPYFEGLIFNVAFFTAGDEPVTLNYVNNNFLKCVGYAYSRAIATTFNGVIFALGGIVGDGSGLSALNASNITDGTLSVSRGGTGLNTIPLGNLLIGNNANTFLQTSNLNWDNANNILNATNFSGSHSGSGAGLINLNVSNANAGTLPIGRGGTGVTTFIGGRLLYGDGVNPLAQSANLTWDNTNNVLTSTKISTTELKINNTVINPIGIATTTTLGTVQIGSGLSITGAGLLSANANVVGIATTTSLGTVQIGSGLSITGAGLLSANVVGIATTTSLGTVQIGSGLSITGAGLLSANAATPYTLPIATNGILGGVKPDVDTIIVNPSTGLMSLSGSDIFLNGTANRAYGWTSSTSLLGRCAVATAYSTNSVINDVVLRSANNLILQSGTTTSALLINTSNQAFFRNAVCIAGTAITAGSVLDITGNSIMRNALVVGGTTITSGYILDVKGDVITSGNINLANTSRSIFWGGTNSNLGRAGVAGEYSTSSAINDIVLRSGNRLLLQSGTGVAGLVINTDNNVAIGAIIPLTTLDVNGNLLIRAYGTTGSGTRGLFFRSDHITTNLQYNCSILTFDHGGGGPTDGLSINGYGGISFCTNANTRQERMRIASSGFVGISNSAPIAPLTIGNSALANQDGFLVLGKCTTIGTTRHFRIGLNDNFDLALGDYGGNNVAGTWTQALRIAYGTSANTLYLNADYVGVGVSPSYKCHIKCSYNDVNRALHLDAGDTGPNQYALTIWPYVVGGGQVGWRFRTQSQIGGDNTPLAFTNDGTIRFQKDRWHGDSDGVARLYFEGNATTYINGNTGGQGNLVEFRSNTDTMRARINNNGQFACHFQTIGVTNTDYIGVNTNTGSGSFGYYFTFVLFNTFTGFHRCYYKDDEIFNNDMTNEEVDIFKNNYKGRIVVSTGKIKTDLSQQLPQEEEPDNEYRPINYEEIKNQNPNYKWISAIDKDGITIEDAIPIVQLCRVKKDKRVYGVLGSPERNTNNKKRLIVNSVGEGAICVCNTNGNIENGDYIQSSDILGYGEKQDDDLLHNYTVAKAVMDCSFELDSPYYQCFEIENGLRVAFIACTYHCG